MKYYYFVQENGSPLKPRKKAIYALKPETALHYALSNIYPINPVRIVFVCDNGLIYRADNDSGNWVIKLMLEVNHDNIPSSSPYQRL